MSEGEIETYKLDFFENVKESKFEKPIFKTVTNADITNVSEVQYNPTNGEGTNKKDGRPFKKLYFSVTYSYAGPDGVPVDTIEHYGFRFYEDKKEVWWGSEDKSACGMLVKKIKMHTPNLGENPSIAAIIRALNDRSVKIHTMEFGPSKSKKTMIETFL